MTRFATRLLPEVEAILVYNGIDVQRCTDVTIHHSVEGVTTGITVTMLALKPPEDES